MMAKVTLSTHFTRFTLALSALLSHLRPPFPIPTNYREPEWRSPLVTLSASTAARRFTPKSACVREMGEREGEGERARPHQEA